MDSLARDLLAMELQGNVSQFNQIDVSGLQIGPHKGKTRASNFPNPPKLLVGRI
jgi:hypothetical protein